jgi:NAD(P)-dependent dehydrogenase (short-subunit alcohol dehydrogenase family)
VGVPVRRGRPAFTAGTKEEGVQEQDDGLHGRVAVVTGGGSGIGRASALAFARAGVKVVVADADEGGGAATVRSIAERGGAATFVRADVARTGDAERLVKAAVEAYGRLDCAHNNAGIEGNVAPGTTFHEYPEPVWDEVLRVNLKGVWLCLKAELKQMLAQEGGAIVNTASVAGLVGGAGPAYTASKHGVVGLTKTAALEYAQRGVRVNAVCPGVIRTPMVERIFAARPESEERWLAGEPVGRFGAPEEVAAAVVWLCSDAAAFVTGVALPVDGGWVAR